MKNMISLIKFTFQKKSVYNFFFRKRCVHTYIWKTMRLLIRLSMFLIKLKCACHFFIDYDDVFSHYVTFVIDTTQVLGDLHQKKVVKLCCVEFPDCDAVSKYIQDACVGGLCISLPNLAKGHINSLRVIHYSHINNLSEDYLDLQIRGSLTI